MASSNAAKITRSSLWLMASYALAKGSRLITQIFLARLLSPEDFGLWGMVLVITTLSELFRDTAIASVLVQRGLEDKDLVNAVYSLGINVSIIMFLIQTGVGFLIAPFFNEPMVGPLTACTGLVFLVGAGAGSHTAVLTRQMQFRALAIADSSAGFARLVGAAVGAFLGAGVWSFAIAEVTRGVADASIKRRLSQYRFTYSLRPDPKVIQQVWRYISSLIGTNIAVYVNTNGDDLITGKVLGAKTLGYYTLAYQLAMVPTFALSQVNRINFSVLSQRDNQGKKLYVAQVLELYAILYALIYGLGFLISPWMIPFIYGSQWQAAVPLFQIILVFAYTRGFMSIFGTTLNSLNKPDVNAAINWILVPLSIPAFLVGIWLDGVQGLAIAVALVMGIGAAAWFWIATCHVAQWDLKTLMQPILLPSLSIGLILAVLQFMAMNLVLQILVMVVTYGAALSLFSMGEIPQKLLNLGRRTLKT
ncbi:MAG: oligosaccharide flippase family protein [Leptolyngbyaceae cyanobacterium MAG.088]|nr:oligosaccharide flippase family protein [Leptolyngbyaceae cyanobacterium MAG.088]